MELQKLGAEIFIPDGTPLPAALARTTALAISAHQDDIEFMAFDGIIKCFGRNDAWFTGVVLTDGKGSPRDDLYADFSDEQMQAVRRLEQKKAAFVGEYAAQLLLNYGSAEVKDPSNRAVIQELKEIFKATRPETVYTHNPADKHDTHVAAVLKVLQAIRELPRGERPARVYGCEVWRDLDWLADDRKVVFDLSSHENIAAAVAGVFDSQICGGKRYDLAIMGRRRAHATFAATHGVDQATALGYAMDLTPLIQDDTLEVKEYVTGYIRQFVDDVAGKITKLSQK